jgi:sulfatase modifying factor 1
MRSVARWLVAVLAVGCEPSGVGTNDATIDTAPGDVGTAPGDAAAEIADAAPDADAPETQGDAAAPDVSTAPDAPTAADTSDAAERVDLPGEADATIDATIDAAIDAATDTAADADVPTPDVPCTTPACRPVQRSCAGGGLAGCGMVVLDGGRFSIGTPTQCFTLPDATCGYSAAPTQTDLTVGRFAIDAYEVTVARFNAYWAARGRDSGAVRGAPVRYRGGEIAWVPPPNAEPTRQGRDHNWLPTTSSRDAHPINGVDFWMALEFCVWDGGRLPTEAEWEYVARAAARDGLAAGRSYPWGDDPPSTTCDRARWTYTTCPAGEDGARTVRVGRYPTGAAGGVFDLAGNVWEWTADNFTSYSGGAERSACENRSGAVDPLCLTGIAGDSRVIRGGAWGDSNVANLRAASRGSFNPAIRSFNIGFRCARDLPP